MQFLEGQYTQMITPALGARREDWQRRKNVCVIMILEERKQRYIGVLFLQGTYKRTRQHLMTSEASSNNLQVYLC